MAVEEGIAHQLRLALHIHIDRYAALAHARLTRLGTDCMSLMRPISVVAGSKASMTCGMMSSTLAMARIFPNPTEGSPRSARLTVSVLTPARAASSAAVMPSMRLHVER